MSTSRVRKQPANLRPFCVLPHAFVISWKYDHYQSLPTLEHQIITHNALKFNTCLCKIKSIWGNSNSPLIAHSTPQEYQLNSELGCVSILRDVICHFEIMSCCWPSAHHAVLDSLRKYKEWYASSHLSVCSHVAYTFLFRNPKTIVLICHPCWQSYVWCSHGHF